MGASCVLREARSPDLVAEAVQKAAALAATVSGQRQEGKIPYCS
jgi:hypothetical protein